MPASVLVAEPCAGRVDQLTMISGMTTTKTLELGPDEWPTWRELRLAALAEAPEAFGFRLSVKTTNHHAIGLNQRHGFADSGPSPGDASERRMCH